MINLSFPLPLFADRGFYTRLVQLLKQALNPDWGLLPFVNLGEGDITTLYIDDVPQENAQVIVNTVYGIVADILEIE